MINTDYDFIETQDHLKEVLPYIREPEVIFLDTEFLKRNTFYPILALIQINANNHTYIIDAMHLQLDELWEVLSQKKLWVLHACSEDIDLICYYANTRTIPPVFDTQIGISYLPVEQPSTLQMSYQAALAELIDVEIDKGESCSNWVARPLRDEQLDYAANDVIYLPDLYEEIQKRLKNISATHDLRELALADSMSFCNEIILQPEDSELYKDPADFRYTREQLLKLQKICVFRENIARLTNIPRTFVIQKAALKELTLGDYKTIESLHGIKGLPSKMVRQYGKQILECVTVCDNEVVRKLEDGTLPQKVHRPYREDKNPELQVQVMEKVAQVTDNINIKAEIALRKRWRTTLYVFVARHGESLENLRAHKHELNSYLQDWRFETIVMPVLEIIQQNYRELHLAIIPKEQQTIMPES